jgi:hypothetical protein
LTLLFLQTAAKFHRAIYAKPCINGLDAGGYAEILHLLGLGSTELVPGLLNPTKLIAAFPVATSAAVTPHAEQLPHVASAAGMLSYDNSSEQEM